MDLYLSQSYEAPALIVQEFRNQIAKYNHVNVRSFHPSWGSKEQENAIKASGILFVILPTQFYYANGQIRVNDASMISGVIGKGLYTEIELHHNVYIISLNNYKQICLTYFNLPFDDLDIINEDNYKQYANIICHGADDFNSIEDIVGPASSMHYKVKDLPIANFRRIAGFALRH